MADSKGKSPDFTEPHNRAERQLNKRVIDHTISSHQQKEEAWRVTGRDWQATFDAISNGVILLNRESVIVQANQAFLDFVGKPATEVVGRHCWELVHSSEAPILECPLVRMWRSHRRETQELELGNRWFLVSADPILDKAGHITGGVHILADITERKQVEEALRESEIKYRTLFESSADGVFLMTDIFLDCNEQACKLWKCDRGDIVGHSPLEFSPEFQPDARQSAEAAQEYITAAFGGLPQIFYWQHRRKDGVLIDTEISLKSIMVGGQKILQSTMRDITERKRTEEALRESEQKYRELVENANSIILRWTKEGKITFLNEFGQKFFGYMEDEIIGRHVIGTIVPQTESTGRGLQPLIEEITADPKKFEYNINENMRSNGERVWIAWTNKIIFDSQGQMVEILSIGSDITERKQAEAARRDSEERLRLAVEGSAIGLWEWEPNNNYVYFSSEWKKQLGYEDLELSNRFEEWESRLHPEDHDRVLTTMKAYWENSWPDYEMEFRLQHKDGSYRWIMAKGAVNFDQTGRPVRMLGSHLDITRRKMMEQELAEASDQLRGLAARLAESEDAERKRLARELHDQVGQNLTALSVNLNLVNSLLPGEAMEQVRSRLNNSMTLLKQTGKVIRNLMAELRPSVLDDYGLVAALRWYVGEFTSWAGIEVEVQGEEFNPRLEQTVENVFFRISQEALTNVAKHSRASRAVISLEDLGDKVKMVISDNGVGFNPVILGKPEGEHGWGMLNMQERALAVGGSCRIETSPAGVKVAVEVNR